MKKKLHVIFLVLFLWVSFNGKSQVQLVINEVTQGYSGSQEYVELLVVGTPTCNGIPTYDIRNYYIDDNNGTFAAGTGTGIASGCIRLTTDALWSNVPAGTLILIYNDADLNTDVNPANDDFSTTDGNCRLQIPVSNCVYLDHNTSQPAVGNATYPTSMVACGNWNNVAMANSDDSFQTLDASGNLIHAVSWSNNNSSTIIYFAGGQTGMVCAMHNLVNNNIANQSNWTSVAVSSTAQTPGYPNDAANAAWINSMNNGCTALSPLTALTTFTNAGCTCTGVASVSASGAIAPYTYSWSTASTSSSVSGLCSGTYTVNVTSSNGCVKTSTVAITGGSGLSSALTSTNVNCNGGSTGTASVSVSGGSGSYTYTWSPSGGNSSSASGLSAGNYTVSFHDGSGCAGSNTVAITQPTVALTATANVTASVTCNGGSTGSASVSVSGGTAGYTYTWSPSGGNTTTASGLTAGNYTVNIKDSKGCTANKTVSVTQPASAVSVSFTNAPISCTGDGTVTAIGNGGTPSYTYLWNTGANAATLSGVAPGAYTVTVTDANLCTKTGTVSVTANSQPTVSVNSYTICNGNVVTITAIGASTYTWNTSATTSSISVNPSSNSTYTVTGASAAGCTNTAVSTVSVNPLPTVSVNSATICAGSVATLTATGANTYTWNTGSTTNPLSVSPGTTTNYTVTGTNTATGCTNTAVGAVSVNPLPTYSLSGSAYSICSGGSQNISISGANTYTWTPSTGLSTTSGSLIVASPTTTTVYNVTGTSTAGCTNLAPATVTVTVSPAPTLSLTGGNTYAICNGASQNLTVNPSLSSYTWTPAGSLNNPNIQSPTATPTTTTIYTVSGTAAGCTASSPITLTITVNPLPVYTLTSNAYTICDGSTQTLHVSGASTYTWTPSSTLNNTNIANPIANPTTTTVYSVTGTSASGCTNTTPATVTVNVNPLPTYSLSGNVYTICSGGSQTFSVSGSAITYTWTPSTTLIGANTANPTANPTTTTVYSVTGTDNNGCTNPTPATVTVNVSPVPSLSLAANSYTICNGNTQIFTVSGGSSYTWTPSSGLNNPNIASPTANPTTTTVYTVSGTASGCAPSSPLTLTLTVNPLPVYTLTSNAYTICDGSTQTLHVGGAVTYTWTPSSTLNNANIANPIANPTATTVYSVTGTNASGCTNTIPATVTVNVNPMPTYSLSGNVYTICSGGSQTFSVSGACITYTWTPAATLINPNTSHPTASPTATTIYSVTGTDNNGCTNPTPATVTVNVSPVPSLSLAANSYTICNGNSQTFIASGASTYTWTPSSGLNNPNIASPTTNPTTTTVYTVSGTASGCAPSSPLTLTLTVNPLPTYSLISNTYTICNGNSQALSISGANTYTWLPASTLTGANTANPTANPTTTTVYSVTGTDINGCTNLIPATATVNVNPLPTYSLTGNAYTICNGGAQILGVSGATSYTWTPSTTLDNPNIATPTASPTTTTIYSVTGTDNNGCTNPIPATVTVNLTAAPSLSLTANSYTICNGSSQVFAASGVSSYTWTPATTLDNPNIAGPTANPTSTTVYTVSGTASGCAPSSPLTLTLTVNPLPILDLVGNSYSVCSGSSQTFSVSGANTYTWAPSATLDNPNIVTPTANPTVTTTYSVTGTDANGCTNLVPSTVTLNINPLPTYSLSGSLYSICTGGSATFTVSGATSYTWTPSATLDNPNIANPTANPTITTTYSVTGTDGNNCTNLTPATVTVDVASAPSLTLASNAYGICNGSSQTFTVSGGNTYTWTPATTLDNPNIANPTANPTTTTVYTVSGTASGCAPSTPLTLTLTVNPLPVLTITSNSYEVCSGTQQTFTVSGASTYTWIPSATLTNANTANPTATTTATTTYSVMGTDTNGCISSAPDTVLLTVNALPALTLTAANSGTVCSGSATVLTATGTGLANATYSWGTGVTTLTNTLNVTPVSSPEIYSVTATNTVTGCSSATATTAVTISPTPTITVLDPNSANSSTICLNNSVNLTASGASTYTWSPTTGLTPSTGSLVTASPTNTNTPTIYAVTGTSAAGCLSTPASEGTYTVTVNPLPVLTVASNSYSVCSGTQQTFTVSGASTYTWTPSATLTGANTATPIANTNTTTTYSVTGTDAAGCSSVIPDTVRLTVYQLPNINVSTQTIAADTCGKGTGGVNNITVSGGSPAYNYIWYSVSTGSMVSTSPSLSNVPTGSYSLEVIDTHSCVATVSGGPDIFVIPTATVIASFYTNPNPATGNIPLAVSFTNTSIGATNYIWYFGDTTHAQSTSINPNFTYTTIGTHTVILVAINGSCTDTARTIVITDAPTTLIIPNIFSPNGDGVNDQFFIINTGINSLNCLIYNRWGELLATLNSPNQVWDGRTPNGENAPDGTYFYILEAQGLNGKTYKQNGPLTLVR